MLRLAALALIASAGLLASSQPAECTWCPTYTCYGPCGQGCACISQPGAGRTRAALNTASDSSDMLSDSSDSLCR
jgi:hypothetical protein